MYGLQWFQSNNKEVQFIGRKNPDFQSGRTLVLTDHESLVAKNNNNNKHCKQN